MHDRASDVFLPRKHYEPIANDDRLVFNGIGEAGINARNDFHGQLPFGAEGDPGRECRKRDFKDLADAKGRYKRRTHQENSYAAKEQSLRKDDASGFQIAAPHLPQFGSTVRTRTDYAIDLIIDALLDIKSFPREDSLGSRHCNYSVFSWGIYV
jgi:hypothetical protein